MHFLIVYANDPDHKDPLFEEFTYGECQARSRRLKECLEKGDYVFFHITVEGFKYITAYYVVEHVLTIAEISRDMEILGKYRNPHILRILNNVPEDKGNVVVFGSPTGSRILKRREWLHFDRSLVDRLSLKIKYSPNLSEARCISNATRVPRTLTDEDVKIILNEIHKKGMTTGQ